MHVTSYEQRIREILSHVPFLFLVATNYLAVLRSTASITIVMMFAGTGGSRFRNFKNVFRESYH